MTDLPQLRFRPTPPGAPYPEQSQAATVLVLGILSIVLCQLLGPVAWKLGATRSGRSPRAGDRPRAWGWPRPGGFAGSWVAACWGWRAVLVFSLLRCSWRASDLRHRGRLGVDHELRVASNPRLSLLDLGGDLDRRPPRPRSRVPPGPPAARHRRPPASPATVAPVRTSGTPTSSANAWPPPLPEDLVAAAVVGGEPAHVLDDADHFLVDRIGHEGRPPRHPLGGRLGRGDQQDLSPWAGTGSSRWRCHRFPVACRRSGSRGNPRRHRSGTARLLCGASGPRQTTALSSGTK